MGQEMSRDVKDWRKHGKKKRPGENPTQGMPGSQLSPRLRWRHKASQSGFLKMFLE